MYYDQKEIDERLDHIFSRLDILNERTKRQTKQIQELSRLYKMTKEVIKKT